MVVQDIQQFAEIRPKARAYFCYLFHKNLPNHLPSVSIESLTARLLKIRGDLKGLEAAYLLDSAGNQVTPTYLKNGKKEEDIGESRSTRAYYYRAMHERRCTITDPYPSLLNDELTVTASEPIFDEHGDIVYVACIDMPLAEVLKIAHPMALESGAGRFLDWRMPYLRSSSPWLLCYCLSKGLRAFYRMDLGRLIGLRSKIFLKRLFF
jgi:hypothetical protein